MKKSLQLSIWAIALLAFFINSSNINAQVITVGTGINTQYVAPARYNYNYSWSQSLYLSSEINQTGSITKVSFKVSNSPSSSTNTMSNQTVYLYETASTTVLGGYQSPTSMGATLVYSGSITYVNGWVDITLAAPYYYSGTKNLLICVENRQGTATSNMPYFYSSNTTYARCKYYYNSNSANAFANSGYTYSYRPNVRLNFQVSQNDLAMEQWFYPSQGSTTNATMPIMLKVKNVGSVSQTNYDVKYSIDNGANWTSQTVPSSLASNGSTTINFFGASTADMSTAGVYQCIGVVKNSGDTIAINDTIKQNITICNGSYSGSYTIGSDASSDFPDIETAIYSLETCGISGPVTFRIKNGVRTKQIRIGAITGVSASTPVTFESYSGNATDVVYQFASSTLNDNYVLRLDTLSYVTFKNITFKATGSSYGGVVYIFQSNHITFDGNKIIGVDVTGSYSNNNNTLISFKDSYSSNTSNNLTIKNNTLKNGCIGVQSFAYNSGYPISNIEIVNNQIENYLGTGIYLNYCSNYNLEQNTISTIKPSSNGIYINYGSVSQKVTRNKISTSNYTPISIRYSNGTSVSPIEVSNNFLYQSSQSAYSTNFYNNNYLNFDFNSIHTKGSNTYGNVYISYGSNYNLRNNNIINNAGGFPLYISTPTAILTSDYNNYYTSGSNIAYWNGYKTTLAALKSATGKETHSLNNSITFYSDDNLHVSGSSLNNMGTPVTGITLDYDGQTRSTTTPDIGADEYKIYPNDAGLISFQNLTSLCPGSAQNITVNLKNFGYSALTNVKFGMSINGNLQPTTTWNGLLGALNSVNATVGSYTFDPDTIYVIKTWVDSVNNTLDSNAYNDTIVYNDFHTSLAGGTYQIGNSTSADFASLYDAIDAMNTYGICGPIVLNLENGTYIGQYTIGNISGLSAANTITIQSLSGNAADVELKFITTNYVASHIIKLDGAGYTTIKNLSFSTVGSSYSRAINIINSSDHVFIDSCIIKGGNTTSYGDYNSLIHVANSSHIKISNSTFKDGTASLYLNMTNVSSMTDFNIVNNTFSDFYQYGVWAVSLTDSLNIIGNNFDDKPTSSNTYALNCSSGTGKVVIANNNISLTSQKSIYGLYIYRHNYYNQSSANTMKVYNNFIYINSGVNYTIRAIYLTNSNYCSFHYNTIKIEGANANSNAFYCYYSSNTSLSNNSFDAGSHKLFYVYGSSNFISDYNNLYSTVATPMYWSNYNRSIADYKTYSSQDSHSKSVNPNYVSAGDLHLHDVILNNAASPISSILTDIDGETRSTSTPDIGADEFTMLPNDAKLYAINRPSDITAVGSTGIKAALQNMGTTNLVLDSLHYQLDAGTIVSVLWSGNLAPLAIDSFILIGTENLTAGNHSIKVWSTKPNNVIDLNATNDTLFKTFVVQVMPSIEVDPMILSATITTCGDTLIVPLKIKNNGGATLTFTESNSGAAPYDSTSTLHFYSTGATTYHNFTGLTPNADTIVLTLTINGDYDSGSEYVTVYVDNSNIGTYQGGSTNTNLTHVFTLTGSNLATWLADGNLNIRVVNSSSVNTGYGTNLNQVQIQTSGTQWLSSSYTSSVSVAPGDSTILNYTFKSAGLTNGLYTGKIQITSNDLGNPNVEVPCSLTVAGPPSISTSSNSISFGGAYLGIASYDSIEVYNDGCGDLYISNITTTNSAFTALSTVDTIAPGDTAVLVYKFLTSTAGAYAATSTIYNNDANYSINLAANATNPPALTATPSPMNITITNCNDSLTTNLSLQNSGGGTLTATMSPGKDSVNILFLTYGSYSSYNNNMIYALNQNYTKYNITYSYSTNASITQGLITSENIDAIVIPYIGGYGSYYSSLSTTLQNFATAGGTIIMVGQNSNYLFTATGLISGTYSGFTDYKTLTTVNSSDPITLNFNSTYSSSTDDFNYYTFSGTGVTHLVKYGTYDLAVKKQFGSGQVIVIGHNYSQYTQVNTKALFSNAVKSAAGVSAPWMQFTTSTANLSAGTTALKPIKFNANGLATGTYYSKLRIVTNAPTNPVVFVPCTLTVQNQMANGVSLGADTTNCGAITLNAGSYTNYLWNTGNTTQTISAVSTGTYSVTVSNGGNCESSDTIAVTINPIPSINLAGLPTNSCTNDAPITLNASPSGGVFAGSGITNGIFYPAIAGSGNHTISYSYTNAYNCTNSAIQQITVNNPPTVVFTGLNSSYCPQGASSVLTGLPSGGTFSGNGMSGNTFVPALAQLGSNDIVYSYTDANNCSNTDTNTTIINTPSFTIMIAGYLSDVCINTAVTTLVGLPAGGTFSGPGMSGNQFSASSAGLGTHYIKYEKQDGTSCLISDSIAITVHALPTGLGIGGLSQSFCSNGTSVNVATYPAGGVLSGPGIIGNTFNPTVAGSGIHVITYTYTDVFGCASSLNTPAEVDPIPTIAFTNMQSQYCDNDASFTVSATPSGGTLSGDDLNGNVFDPSFVGAGTSYIYYAVTDANSCYNKDSFNIVVNAAPTVNMGSLASTFCSNSQAVALTGTPTGGNFTGMGVSGNNFDPTAAGVGTHFVSYTFTDNNGCSNTDLASTIVSQIHGVNAGSDVSITYNTSTQLTGLVTGGGSSFSFSWTPANKVSNASQLSPSTTNLAASTLFTLSVTDNDNACVNSDDVLITITGGVLTANITSNSSTICEGEQLQLTALGSGGNGNYTYAWSSNPTGFTSSISNPMVMPNVSTVYTCIVGDGTDTIHKHFSLNVDAAPMAQISNLNTAYCNNEASASLIVSPPGGSLVGSGINGFVFDPATASLGQNMVIYSLTNSNGCYGADTIMVAVSESPSAFAGNDTTLPCLNSGLALGQQPIANVSYLWTPAIGLNNSTIANPISTANLTIDYTLTATAANGCTASDMVHVNVVGTPNAVASNDTIVCPYSTVSLSATGGDSYFWSNGSTGNNITVNPAVSTLYYVIVSQNGCSDMDTVYVTIDDPKPHLGNDTTVCASQSITLNGGAGNSSYLWSTGENTQTISIDSTNIGLSSITINVMVVNARSCVGRDTITISFTDCTGLNDVDEDLFSIRIYPNPSSGKFVIESNETAVKDVQMSIMDANGKLIMNKEINNTTGRFNEAIDLSTQAKGVYFIKISNNDTEKVFKVLIQ